MRAYLVGKGSQSSNFIQLFPEINFYSISYEQISELGSSDIERFVIAIGDREIAKDATDQMLSSGFRSISLIHRSAIVEKSAKLSEGVCVLANAYLGPGSVLGPYVLVNTGGIVEHDSKIGQHTIVAPGAVVLGNVEVGEMCLLGANSTILPGLNVARGTTIGAGGTLTKNVLEGNQTLTGVPARVV